VICFQAFHKFWREKHSVYIVVFCGQGLHIVDYHKPLLEATGKELLEEKAEALEVCEH
jgi:hypothetical protein